MKTNLNRNAETLRQIFNGNEYNRMDDYINHKPVKEFDETNKEDKIKDIHRMIGKPEDPNDNSDNDVSENNDVSSVDSPKNLECNVTFSTALYKEKDVFQGNTLSDINNILVTRWKLTPVKTAPGTTHQQITRKFNNFIYTFEVDIEVKEIPRITIGGNIVQKTVIEDDYYYGDKSFGELLDSLTNSYRRINMKKNIKSGRFIKSGAGAGYDVTIEGIELDSQNYKVISDEITNEEYNEHLAIVEVPVKPCLVDKWTAQSYYDGVDSDWYGFGDDDRKIDGGKAVLRVFWTEQEEGRWIDDKEFENVEEAVAWAIPSSIDIKVSVGAGWIHSNLPVEEVHFEDEYHHNEIDLENDGYAYLTESVDLICPNICQDINAFFENPEEYYEGNEINYNYDEDEELTNSRKPKKSKHPDEVAKDNGADITCSRKSINSSFYVRCCDQNDNDVGYVSADKKVTENESKIKYFNTEEDAKDFAKQMYDVYKEDNEVYGLGYEFYVDEEITSSRKSIKSGMSYQDALFGFTSMGKPWGDYWEMQQDWAAYVDSLERDGDVDYEEAKNWDNPCTPQTFKEWINE